MDFIGQRFGRLVVVNIVKAPERFKDRGKKYLLCKCDCGKEKTIYYHDVKSGKTKSCGCLLRETTRALGLSGKRYSPDKSRIKRIWSGMMARCTHTTLKGYPNYGGRGITIFPEWLDFEQFYKWAIENGYEGKLTLDREDNNGNYEPSNCRFITMKLQQNNRRDSKLLNINGEIMTVTQWAEAHNIGSATIAWRVNHGWSERELFIEPNLNNKWRNHIAK